MTKYQVQQRTPDYGGKPYLCIEVNGRPRGIPCGVAAKPGDWLVVLPDAELRVIETKEMNCVRHFNEADNDAQCDAMGVSAESIPVI